jgi:hypothetical protein
MPFRYVVRAVSVEEGSATLSTLLGLKCTIQQRSYDIKNALSFLHVGLLYCNHY